MRLKRLVASVGASFEQFVNKVENHEAVAESVIRDVRAAAAKLKVQMGGVNAQADRLRERRDSLAGDAERWRDRARRFANEDEERALECLRRMKRAEAEQGQVVDQLAQYETLAEKLKDRLAAVEARLSALQLKRTALSSRSARAQVVGAADQETLCDVNAVFDRWEMAVIEDEYLDEIVSGEGDSLERELDAAEEREQLMAALEELRKEDRS